MDKLKDLIFVIIVILLVAFALFYLILGTYGQIKYRNTPAKDVPYWVYAMNKGGNN